LKTRKLIAALNAKTVDRAAFRQMSEKTVLRAKNSGDCAFMRPFSVKTQSA
jgi:hypothetical protein